MKTMQKALIAAGCFWGVEEFYRKINGVEKTTVGYSGGNFINPTYQDVCNGNTGHAEVVLINFIAEKISYDAIINNFWKCHDPTQLNKQGFDIGTQYRSAIFYFNDEQKKIAINSKKKFEIKNKLIAVTEISKAEVFYIAEEYHQCFIQKKSIF
tara:strand:+ start:329 stop:790 length:462 start_codon:yes stop_codon:yes gene_type:complete